MAYMIFDTESGNAVDSFTSEAEAFNVIREAVRQHGREIAELWLLMARNQAGERWTIAEGDALIDMALAITA